MEKWIKEALFTLIGAEFFVTCFLGTLGIGWIPVTILTVSSSIGGLLTINHIIDKKEKEKKEKESYFKTIERNTQYLEGTNGEEIKADKIIPISNYRAIRFVKENPESYEEVQNIVTEIKELKQQKRTTRNKKDYQDLENLQTIYQFTLQDTIKETSQGFSKTYYKK